MPELTIDIFLEKFKRILDRFQVEDSNIRNVFAESNQTIYDFAWFVFNTFLSETAKSNAPDEYQRHMLFKDVYNEMTYFQRHYENKKGNHTHRQSLISEITATQVSLSNQNYSAIAISNKCCDECSKSDGKKVPLEEALENIPIDPMKCTRESGCTCAVGFTLR